jgi:PhoH-like ATPase
LTQDFGIVTTEAFKDFVPDTSVFLYDPDSIEKFGNNRVIIPSVVYEEINLFKEEVSERGFAARKVADVLEMLSTKGSLLKGVKLGQTIIQTSFQVRNEEVRKAYSMDTNDNKIIACAKNHEAILISRDKMMRVMARNFVKAEDYLADKVNVEEVYKGYSRATVPAKSIDRLFKNGLENEFNLFPNEFIILTNQDTLKEVIGILKGQRIIAVTFEGMNKKGLKLKVAPMNLEQKMLMYLLHDDSIPCVTVTGKSGKGKSLHTVDFGLASVDSGFFNQFIYTKSATPVDPREELGFYPGSPQEKLKPHIQPLYSSLEFMYKEELYKGKTRKSVDQKVEELLEQDILKFFPLANIRGMSIFDKAIMLDEAQNTTNHMIKTLVTRVTDSSKLIVTGDIDQIDDRNLNKFNNGLTHLVEAGKTEDFIGHICMDLAEESKRGKLATFGSMKL